MVQRVKMMIPASIAQVRVHIIMPKNRAAPRKVATRARIERAAFALFERVGFEATTIDDIAEAAEIGRRTFFHYFASKNDIPWGGLELTLAELREALADVPPDLPIMDGLREAIVSYHIMSPEEQQIHRQRVHFVLSVPALQAHSTFRFMEWRNIVAEFVARRIGESPDSILPRTISHSSLAVISFAYEQWMQTSDTDPVSLIESGMRGLAEIFAEQLEKKPQKSTEPPKRRSTTSARA